MNWTPAIITRWILFPSPLRPETDTRPSIIFVDERYSRGLNCSLQFPARFI
jgi:hypothetical protein